MLVASTAFSIASTLRAGVREVQVIGSLIAHRIEQETGRPAAPGLVKRLALELYLTPRRTPSTTDRPLPLRRLLQRWLFKGAIGRDTRRAASKALDAAEKLDVRPYLTPPRSAAPQRTTSATRHRPAQRLANAAVEDPLTLGSQKETSP